MERYMCLLRTTYVQGLSFENVAAGSQLQFFSPLTFVFILENRKPYMVKANLNHERVTLYMNKKLFVYLGIGHRINDTVYMI